MAKTGPDLVSSGELSEDIQPVEDFLSGVAIRLRLSAFLRSLSCGLIVCSGLLLAVRALTYLTPAIGLMLGYSWYSVAALYLAAVAFSLLKSFAIHSEMISLARFVDERLGLKDRLSTAISLPLGIASESFASRIAQDAIAAVRSAKPVDAVPLKWRPLYTWSLLALLITIALISLPLSALSVFSHSYLRLVQVVESAPKPTSTLPRSKIPNSLAPVPAPNEPSALTPAGKKSASSSPTQAGKATKKDEEKAAALQNAESLIDRLLTGQSLHQSSGAKAASSSSKRTSSNSSQSNKSGNGSSGGSNTAGLTTLGDKLRQYADRLSQRPLTSGEMSQAAQSLDNINHKLDGYSMPKTQGKLTSAEQDLNDGTQSAAVSDIRSAAYYADNEGAVAPDGQSGASGPVSKNALFIPARNGSAGNGSQGSQGSGSSGGNQGGSSNQQSSNSLGNGSGTGSGAGGSQSSPTSSAGGASQRGQSGLGYGGGTQKPQFGAPRQIDPASLGAPAKLPPISLPISTAGGRYSYQDGSESSPMTKESSVVPFQNIGTRFSTSTERAVTDQQIPPAYKDIVKRYFSSGNPKD